MGIYAIKPRFQQALRSVERPLLRWGVHPDVLTLSALCLSILGGVALYASSWASWTLLAVPVVAMARTALNALDGMVAKDSGLARPWGEVLNELCDRLADVALFAGTAFALGSDARLGAAAISAMLLVSYVGILSRAAGGGRQYGGVMGKADRMLYLSAASVIAFLLPSAPVFTFFLVALLAGLAVTLVQRLVAAYAALKPSR